MSLRPLQTMGCVVAFGIAGMSSSFAAVVPDAGSLLREQQQQRELPRELPETDESASEPSRPSDRSVQVDVRAFRFEGHEGLATEAELQSEVAGSVGKRLDDQGLQAVTARITALLRRNGWFLARAYYPEQDLSNGVVTIGVIPGKNDKGATIEGDGRTRISNRVLLGYARRGVRAGEPIRKDALERSVLLINDLPGINAKVVVSPGSLPQTSAVKYAVTEQPLLGGVVWADNHGNRYTGTWRGNGLLNVNDPFRYGDQLNLVVTGSSGLRYGRIGYRAPIGFNGFEVRASLSGMRYDLQEDFKALDYHGESSIVEAGVRYLLVRSRKSSCTVGATYHHKALSDKRSDAELDDRDIDMGTITLDWVNFDELLGGGSTSWHGAVSHGRFHESNGIAYQDATINGTEGNFTCFSASVGRQQRLSRRVTLDLSWNGQFTLDNLGSSEKFYLGGPYGVRAYPVGEASGDDGQLISANLRYRLPVPLWMGNVELSGFYDAGNIRLNHERYAVDVTNATGRNSYWLQGAGVGLNWVYAGTFVLRTSWAHTIGDNPGRSSGGANADGRKDDSRFWLQAFLYF